MKKELSIDYEKETATVPLSEGPMVLMISDGKARVCALHGFGEFVAKTQDGKIIHFANTEKGKF